MDYLKAAALIAFGSIILWSCWVELRTWARLRRRGVRTTATVVGHRDAGGPGTMQRSGVFEFTTEAGQVIRSASSASTPRGPKPGSRVPIVYDPADPHRTAERRGVIAVKMVLFAPLFALGAGLVVFGLTFLA
jgi:hypothetical protein